MVPVVDKCCSYCTHYYLSEKGKELGECRRYPKVIVHAKGQYFASAFPDMDPTDWCGEWQPYDLNLIPSKQLD